MVEGEDGRTGERWSRGGGIDVRGEQAGAQVTDQATDGVHREDIQCVIDAQQELQLRGVIARAAGQHTVDDRAPGGHVSGPGRDGHQPGHDTGAEPHRRPLPLEAIVEQTPRHSADARCQIGDHGSHDGAHRRTQRGPGVEAEPPDPQEDRADDDLGDVVRAEVELVGAVAPALAEHEGVRERRRAGGDVHGRAAGEVEAAHRRDPAGWVPRPAGDGVVDDRRPEQHEDDTGKHATALGDGTDGESDSVAWCVSECAP